MVFSDEILNKFPCVLKNALYSKKVTLPDNVEFKFDDFIGYRMISRKVNDDTPINKNDFLSQAELKEIGKPLARGIDINDISFYSCSLFKDSKQLQIILHLPRKNKKAIKGIIKMQNGAIRQNAETSHIDWWLYDDVNVSKDFEVIEDEQIALL